MTSSMSVDQASTRDIDKDAFRMTDMPIDKMGPQAPLSDAVANKRKSRSSLAIADMASAIGHRRLWLQLGWNDILQR